MRAIAMNELCNELRQLKQKKVVLTFHTIGDRDAVGSAMALSEFFPNGTVVTPDFITNNARRMLTYIGLANKITANFPESPDAVLIFDANNTFALGRLADRLVPSTARKIFIDHHAVHKEMTIDALMYNDEGYNSTSSIVCDLMKRLEMGISRNAAFLLLNGIVADSAEMQNSYPLTFRQVAELLEIVKLDFSFFSEYVHEGIPLNNRHQVVRDIAEAKSETVGKYLLMYGRATEHANVVADAALKLEADASVFWTSSSAEASVSARLRPPLDKKLSIHLGLIMEQIGSLIGGTGGGHACAAGAYGIKREAAQLAGEETVKRLKEMLAKGGK